jgi:hypothetical protein
VTNGARQRQQTASDAMTQACNRKPGGRIATAACGPLYTNAIRPDRGLAASLRSIST